MFVWLAGWLVGFLVGWEGAVLLAMEGAFPLMDVCAFHHLAVAFDFQTTFWLLIVFVFVVGYSQPVLRLCSQRKLVRGGVYLPGCITPAIMSCALCNFAHTHTHTHTHTHRSCSDHVGSADHSQPDLRKQTLRTMTPNNYKKRHPYPKRRKQNNAGTDIKEAKVAVRPMSGDRHAFLVGSSLQ